MPRIGLSTRRSTALDGCAYCLSPRCLGDVRPWKFGRRSSYFRQPSAECDSEPHHDRRPPDRREHRGHPGRARHRRRTSYLHRAGDEHRRSGRGLPWPAGKSAIPSAITRADEVADELASVLRIAWRRQGPARRSRPRIQPAISHPIADAAAFVHFLACERGDGRRPKPAVGSSLAASFA